MLASETAGLLDVQSSALGMGILLPSLTRAREQAKRRRDRLATLRAVHGAQEIVGGEGKGNRADAERDVARVDEREEGVADGNTGKQPRHQPLEIGLRPGSGSEGAEREDIHEGDERRYDDGRLDRRHGERQERHADDGEPAAEGALAHGHDEDGREADEIKKKIGGHRMFALGRACNLAARGRGAGGGAECRR